MNTYGASSSAANRWTITRTLLVACVSAVLLAGCGGSSNQTGNVPDGNVTAAAPPQQGAQQPTSAQAAKAAKEKAAKEKAAKAKAAKQKAAKEKAAKAKAAKQKAAKAKAAKQQKKKKKKKKVRYENCAAMRAAGAAPIKKGKPGYELRLDRDKDGYACELTK